MTVVSTLLAVGRTGCPPSETFGGKIITSVSTIRILPRGNGLKVFDKGLSVMGHGYFKVVKAEVVAMTDDCAVL